MKLLSRHILILYSNTCSSVPVNGGFDFGIGGGFLLILSAEIYRESHTFENNLPRLPHSLYPLSLTHFLSLSFPLTWFQCSWARGGWYFILVWFGTLVTIAGDGGRGDGGVTRERGIGGPTHRQHTIPYTHTYIEQQLTSHSYMYTAKQIHNLD